MPIENVIGRAFVVVWPSDRFTSLNVPDVWKQFEVDHPTAAAGLPAQRREPDPIVATEVLPLGLGVFLSARSGMSFVTRRRRLRA